MNKILPVVLSIAGSDSGGGAGIQADLKTFTALGTFGTTAVTSITSQNLGGVRSIQPIRPEIVGDQIDAVCEGFSVQAVKTGMLYSREIIEVVADKISHFGLTNLVVDPVFAATSGAALIEETAIEALTAALFPIARVVTPNIPEAEFLCGMEISDLSRMRKALEYLLETYPGPAFVLKGGHLPNEAVDLYGGPGLGIGELRAEQAENINSHGSGCSFASAIAAFLALERDLEEALRLSKLFISGALHNPLCLKGPLRLIDHCWRFRAKSQRSTF